MGEHQPPTMGSVDRPFTKESRPHFFLVRPNGTFVSMIAVDELDPDYRVVGAPSTLTAFDIEDGNMARVGDHVDPPKNFYRVDYIGKTTKYRINGGDQTLLSGKYPLHHNEPVYSHEKTPSQHSEETEIIPSNYGAVSSDGIHVNSGSPKKSDGQNEIAFSPDTTDEDHFAHAAQENKWAKDQHPSKTKHAMTPGVYGKKKFCTYWIRTGNCDYVQEGCKYLHVIPDEETRLRIGIRDMPRWAKEDIPEPEHQAQTKKHPAMNREWRRAPSGTSNEPSQTSTPQSSMPMPAPAPTTMQNGMHHDQHGPTPLSPAAQPFNPQQNRMAAQPSPLLASGGISSAAESFQRQMQINCTPSQSQPSMVNDAPIPNSLSMNGHGPIGRPNATKFRAPDRMMTPSHSISPIQHGHISSPSTAFSAMNRQTSTGPFQPAGSASITGTSIWNHNSPVLSPAAYNRSIGSCHHTPAAQSGANGVGDHRSSTPASATGLSFARTMGNASYNTALSNGQQQTNFGSNPNVGLGLSFNASNGQTNAFRTQQHHTESRGVGRFVSMPVNGQTDGISDNQKRAKGPGSSPLFEKNTGPHKGGCIFHPRRFKAPGQAKYAEASVTEFDPKAENEFSAGEHIRGQRRGRGRFGAQLVDTS